MLRKEMTDLLETLVLGNLDCKFLERLSGKHLNVIGFGHRHCRFVPSNPAFHPLIRPLAFRLVIGVGRVVVHEIDAVAHAVGFVQFPDRREIVALEVLGPVVHGEVLQGSRQPQRADLRVIGELHHSRKVVAVTVLPVGKHDLAEVTRQPHDRRRAHAVVHGS